ncbi:MAG TPA: CRTAC1 family protein [Thermoanaerobaculia bacterium]|nr:CRTAC1 family protein [Thermoanaerobaculia bacterium]
MVPPRGPSSRGASPPLRAILLLASLAAAGLACACTGPGGAASGEAAADRGPQVGGSEAAGGIFRDRAAEAGLDFVHDNGRRDDLHLAEITCGAAALADLDGDGDLDVFLPQGEPLPGSRRAGEPPPPHRLYRNDLPAPGGAPRFTDVTAAAGIAPGGYGCAVAAGDYDNDGRTDLYLGNLGPNRLLRNRGDGTFEDVTAATGTGDPGSSVAATFLDYDRDGWLDLFVANNLAFTYDDPPVCRSVTGTLDYCGPGAWPGQADRLYRNRGDGTFEDATAAAGMTGGFGPALGVVAADLDGDGWVDLYVANDGQPNNLWINRGDGTFEDRALIAGAAVNGAGVAEASMGVDAGDYDGDGDLDLFLTHLDRETNTLYRNEGNGLFEDRSQPSGLAAPSVPFTSFGTAFFDYDLDGRLDLFVASGAVVLVPELVRRGDPMPLHMTNQLFRNLGAGDGGETRFAEVTAEAGAALALSEVSRAAAFGDVDDDGDPDVLVANNAGPVRLLVNEAPRPAGGWLGVRLLTGAPPRDALGAMATLLRRGAPPLTRRVAADGSYSAANDPRIVFGLGGGGEVTGLRVRWPDGTVQELAPPPSGRYSEIRQGGAGGE